MPVMELIKDSEDGKLSHSKIGVIIAGFVFTLKMLGVDSLMGFEMPSDPLLWFVFMGTVGGYVALLKLINQKKI